MARTKTCPCCGIEEIPLTYQTCCVCKDTPVHKGFSRKTLWKAFNRIQSRVHWKLPIDITLPASEAPLANEATAAVGFYAGGGLKVSKLDLPSGPALHFEAPGYYALIGA
jgi:hypothetical protein